MDLLAAVDRGQRESTPVRALTLLGAAMPDVPPQALADLAIGERDGRLLRLREALFGFTLDATTNCPTCGAPLDLSFATSALRDPGGESDAGGSVSIDGWDVGFRLPTSVDLIALAGEDDLARARGRLVARCVSSVTHDGQPASPDQLPAHVVTALGARMHELDPQACVELSIACPSCGHVWNAELDVAAFLWAEADAWARQIVRDVHALASAYGWSERDVLAMSPWRRGLYLDLVAS
jgi:hypothetical protein